MYKLDPSKCFQNMESNVMIISINYVTITIVCVCVCILWGDELAHGLTVVAETVSVLVRLVRIAAVRYEADFSVNRFLKQVVRASVITTASWWLAQHPSLINERQINVFICSLCITRAYDVPSPSGHPGWFAPPLTKKSIVPRGCKMPMTSSVCIMSTCWASVGSMRSSITLISGMKFAGSKPDEVMMRIYNWCNGQINNSNVYIIAKLRWLSVITIYHSCTCDTRQDLIKIVPFSETQSDRSSHMRTGAVAKDVKCAQRNARILHQKIYKCSGDL